MTDPSIARRPPRQYFGKYRGTVIDNRDPRGQCRLKVLVPDVLERSPSGWALPCVPVAGGQHGLVALPMPGSAVWVEFEQGDPEYPIWVGCFWGSQEDVPGLAPRPNPGTSAITWQTPLSHGIRVSDVPGTDGGILLQLASGASIVINDAGIVLDNGRGAKIALLGNSVDVNDGALTVT